ncbi:MAG: ADP-dependent glucokinase/phosphofructokinase [Candidatus Nanosalina sp.]
MRFQEAPEILEGEKLSILAGFNANIDVLYDLEDLDLDLTGVEPELPDTIAGLEDLKSSLKFCVENGRNEEINRENFTADLAGGKERIGGQAGIMANFLSGIGEYTVFYTPLLSKEIAEKMHEEIVYPVAEGGLRLKRVSDSVNTDRTKRNTIIEFEEDETGRLIVSDSVRGFGPYFRQGIEDQFDSLGEELDAIILSGFQNVEGNHTAKFNKARQQLSKLDVPKHLEYVTMDYEKADKVLEDLLEEFYSIGMDEEEAKEVSRHLGIEVEDEVSLGEAFKIAEELVDSKVSRCHIHTYRYHLIVASEDHYSRMEKIRKSMLFGTVAALELAEKGSIPSADGIEKFDLEDKHVHRLDELENFGHHLDLENFAETGMTEIEGKKVVAVPNMIHETPERLVGMGDVISSGSFAAEMK